MIGKVSHGHGCWIDSATGSVVRHTTLMQAMAKRSAVLLGETHDSYEIHRWQLHVMASLHALRDDIVVGFEMFPRSVQPALDRWVEGETDVDTFLAEAKWAEIWRFDPALYLPIFHFCRQFRLPMIALNCRRSLVTEVGELGWEGIAPEERDGLTPSAPATPEYRNYLFEITGGAHPDRKARCPKDAEFDRFVRAQQTWDRAFACGIAAARVKYADPLVVGIIGRGHLEFGHGTPYQLRDLGILQAAVLLPHHPKSQMPQTGIADACFRLSEDR
ncbi:hypothetical protein GAO09_11740 [Rhizobiales bacterium RZME27]|uniref:Haem-binding uptake Tiki superfamily ChaN domain-containing protein n=1 Tax=Endobacterium cereale TaxID=2663029 RepID=A0A6A8A5Z7_9HYPH|nr:ChaN family lipoprotein [Endobacterium cereale]MEB2847959.1 ChaN family lipoprotein [Endobacterium cereale]MQY46705.1 hypothetical protein [Endobacterium cereale]